VSDCMDEEEVSLSPSPPADRKKKSAVTGAAENEHDKPVGTQDTTSLDKKGEDAKAENAKSDNDPNKITVGPDSKETVSKKDHAEETKESGDHVKDSNHDRQEQTALEKATERKADDKDGGARSRSLSPVSDEEVEVLARPGSAEKRRLFRQERQKRVDAFHADLTIMMAALEKQRSVWIDDPDGHCDYEREWKKFWAAKTAELRGRGVDPATFDLTPEWTLVWKEYFEADVARRIKKEREVLMRKHKLLPRDLVDSSKQLASPNHSIISSSSSLSNAEDSNRIGRSVSRQPDTEKRCGSPWEEEGEGARGPPSAGPSKKVRYHTFFFADAAYYWCSMKQICRLDKCLTGYKLQWARKVYAAAAEK